MRRYFQGWNRIDAKTCPITWIVAPAAVERTRKRTLIISASNGERATARRMSKTPQLAAARRHQKVQAITIGQLQRLVLRYSIEDCNLRKRHAGTRSFVRERAWNRTRTLRVCHRSP
jgi:hypothetical protein